MQESTEKPLKDRQTNRQTDRQADRQAGTLTDERLTYPGSYHWRVRGKHDAQVEKECWFVVSSD